MRILVADDDRVSRAILVRALEGWKFDVVTADDGEGALATLRAEEPSMAVLDWMMPGLDGPQVCQRIRQEPALAGMYVLLLSARGSRADLVAGLEAGADDYITKPFDPDELRARINVGMRVLALQERLGEQVTELQTALNKVRQLQGLLPICSYCKAVRSDNDYWERIDTYITQHSDTQFSHGICPNCMDRALKDMEIPESEAPPALKRGLFGRWR
jgi:sigma-B regulation protein RsbU (phosphoserine phosphatase)